MTTLITGIRGSIGGRVAAELHAHGVDVRGGSAGEETPPDKGYPVVRLNLNEPATLAAALDGVDRVFLYAPRSGVAEVVHELRTAAVQQVVVLSSASIEMAGAEAIADHHRAVEDAVRDAGLPWTFLRPGVFANNALAWAAQVRAGTVALPYAGAYVEPIHEADVADAAIAALTEDGHLGQAYFLTGPDSLTQRQQVELIATALGRALDVQDLTPDQWRAQVGSFIPAVVVDALLDLWQQSDGRPGPTDRTIREVTGAPARSFATWAADHAADFG